VSSVTLHANLVMEPQANVLLAEVDTHYPIATLVTLILPAPPDISSTVNTVYCAKTTVCHATQLGINALPVMKDTS
jgi:hypothetical protein